MNTPATDPSVAEPVDGPSGPLHGAAPATERAQRSGDALARHRSAVRRSRTIYAAVVGAVVLVLGVVVAVAWSRGEVGSTSLRTAAHPPPVLRLAAPSQNQHMAWRTGDRVAQGEPLWQGTAVTFGPHAVRGRDARTGAVTWSYTRSNRTVCTATQTSGVTMALVAVDGNCDEVTALDSATGRRQWTRTLDKDGMPVDGRPVVQALPSTVLVTTPTVIYALEPVTGFDRWTYERKGCTIRAAVLGNDGALISQSCTASVRCDKQKFCGVGSQLLLRDAETGADDKSETNPDKIKWSRRGSRAVPVSADALTSAFDPASDRLTFFDPAKGAVLRTVTLSPAPAATSPVTAVATDHAEIVTIGTVTYAVDSARTRPLWAVPTRTAPTVTTTGGNASLGLSTARITVGDTSGISRLDGNDGTTAQSFAVPAIPADARVYPVGTGFLVSGRGGTAAYR